MRITTDRVGMPNTCSGCRPQREPKAKNLHLDEAPPKPIVHVATAIPSMGDLLDRAAVDRLRIATGDAWKTAESAARRLAFQIDVPFTEAVEMVIARLNAQQG
jgi:hypothetical protein